MPPVARHPVHAQPQDIYTEPKPINEAKELKYETRVRIIYALYFEFPVEGGGHYRANDDPEQTSMNHKIAAHLMPHVRGWQSGLTLSDGALGKKLKSFVNNMSARLFTPLRTLREWMTTDPKPAIDKEVLKHIRGIFNRPPAVKPPHAKGTTYAQMLGITYHIHDLDMWVKLVDGYSQMSQALFNKPWHKRDKFLVTPNDFVGSCEYAPSLRCAIKTIFDCVSRERFSAQSTTVSDGQLPPVTASSTQELPVTPSNIQLPPVVTSAIQPSYGMHSGIQPPSAMALNIQAPSAMHSGTQSPSAMHSGIQSPYVTNSSAHPPSATPSSTPCLPVMSLNTQPSYGMHSGIQSPSAMTSSAQPPSAMHSGAPWMPATPSSTQSPYAMASTIQLLSAAPSGIQLPSAMHSGIQSPSAMTLSAPCLPPMSLSAQLLSDMALNIQPPSAMHSGTSWTPATPLSIQPPSAMHSGIQSPSAMTSSAQPPSAAPSSIQSSYFAQADILRLLAAVANTEWSLATTSGIQPLPSTQPDIPQPLATVADTDWPLAMPPGTQPPPVAPLVAWQQPAAPIEIPDLHAAGLAPESREWAAEDLSDSYGWLLGAQNGAI